MSHGFISVGSLDVNSEVPSLQRNRTGKEIQSSVEKQKLGPPPDTRVSWGSFQRLCRVWEGTSRPHHWPPSSGHLGTILLLDPALTFVQPSPGVAERALHKQGGLGPSTSPEPGSWIQCV